MIQWIAHKSVQIWLISTRLGAVCEKSSMYEFIELIIKKSRHKVPSWSTASIRIRKHKSQDVTGDKL